MQVYPSAPGSLGDRPHDLTSEEAADAEPRTSCASYMKTLQGHGNWVEWASGGMGAGVDGLALVKPVGLTTSRARRRRLTAPPSPG